MHSPIKTPLPSLPHSPSDTLFGDLPLDAWPPIASAPSDEEPWRSFIAARTAVKNNNLPEAITLWQRITTRPHLESRHTLQAWHFLRTHNVQPPEPLHKHLLGVVFEVALNGGLDLLAAYPDHNARYYNFSGAGILWGRPNDSLDADIDTLLAHAQKILNAIGPWDQPRRPAPPQGGIRINLLSPAGLHFGQGDFQQLHADPFARPTIDAGIALMQKLTNLTPPKFER